MSCPSVRYNAFSQIFQTILISKCNPYPYEQPSSAATGSPPGWSLPAPILNSSATTTSPKWSMTRSWPPSMTNLKPETTSSLMESRPGWTSTCHFTAIWTASSRSRPRRGAGAPAHDQRGKHTIVGELSAPNLLGAVEEFQRLQRLPPDSEDAPKLKASVPGPYTLSGRLLPNTQYPDRYAVTEALLPIVRRELEALVEAGVPGDHRRRTLNELLRLPRRSTSLCRYFQPHGRACCGQMSALDPSLLRQFQGPPSRLSTLYAHVPGLTGDGC